MSRSKAYKYSKYQYRVDVRHPDGRTQRFASYVHRENAQRMAHKLAACEAIRVTITRKCDGRSIYDSHRNAPARRTRPDFVLGYVSECHVG